MSETNEVATPANMSDEAFTALVKAKIGVAGFLADPNVLPTLETESDAYFQNLGPFFVEQFVEQTTPDSVIGQRVRKLPFAFETVTPEQEAAAVAAVSNAKADAPVPSTPAGPVADNPKPAVVSIATPVSGPVTIGVKHGESTVEIIGDDLHAAFEAVVAFFKKVGHAL